jgi:hypothetical protein
MGSKNARHIAEQGETAFSHLATLDDEPLSTERRVKERAVHF